MRIPTQAVRAAVVVLSLWFWPSLSWACPSLSTARDWYFAGRVQDAIAGLECLKKAHPNDLDVRGMLSNVEWWQGNADQSIREAREAEALNPWENDPELGIRLAERENPFHLTLLGDGVWGSGRSGGEFYSNLNYRLEDRDVVQGGYSHSSRKFGDDSPVLQDDNIRIGYIHLEGDRTYIETFASYSPEHNFSPEVSLGVAPHYVFKDDSDVSFLVGFEHFYSYEGSQEVVILSPDWRKSLDLLTLDLRVNLLISSEFIPSVLGTASYRIDPKTSIGASIGGGRGLEAPQLTDSFYTVGAVVTRFLRADFSLNLQCTLYRGQIYSENRVGLGADWFF